MPRSLSTQRGVSLVEVLIYSVILSVVLLAVYQTRNLLTTNLYQSINASTAVIDASNAIAALQKEVQLSDIPIKILDQAQDSGAPAGTGTANCIEMQKLVLGARTTYAVSLRWDSTSNRLKLVHYKTNGCSSPPATSNVTDLSLPIFQKSDAANFFTGIGIQVDNGFREANFNFKTTSGQGTLASGLINTTVQLSTNTLTPHECRVASPDKSWFTDFSGKKIRSVTVAVTQNLESAFDRLAYEGTTSGLEAKSINDIGVLHLHAKDGRTVDDWISALANVTFKRAAGSPAITESMPPKRITFVLGDGLSFSPAGLPSTHFYLAIKLTNTRNFSSTDTLAKSTCYPAFVEDSNFLAQGAKPSGSSDSCGNSGSIRRLTGHLATISTEGEQEFIRTKVLKLVYPESAPYVADSYNGAFSQTDTDRTPSVGNAWLGGEFSSSFYRWTRGYETSRTSTEIQFANTNLTPQSGYGSAGKFFVSLKSSLSGTTPTSGHVLFYKIDGNGSPLRYWDVQSSATTADMSHLLVEFGDNRNADGSTGAEGTLNSEIRLKKDVSIIPLEFFNSCRQ